jgi:prepilin-type N-terminal cleavage/methylation domain-containing protein
MNVATVLGQLGGEKLMRCHKNCRTKKQLQESGGYSLAEIMAVVVILGILAAATGAYLGKGFGNPIGNAADQTAGLLKLTRMRAISTTSAFRVKPDPASPTTKFKIEIAKTRGCDATTELTAAATSTDADLTVASSGGFVVGDSIAVGGDTSNNSIIATTPTTITLGQALGSSQAVGAAIELVNNWSNDSSLLGEDLTLPKDIRVSGNPTNWTLCFNSRGIAFLYDANGIVNSNLTLTLTQYIDNQALSNQTKTVEVLQGGAIQVSDP